MICILYEKKDSFFMPKNFVKLISCANKYKICDNNGKWFCLRHSIFTVIQKLWYKLCHYSRISEATQS
jgi:hypothetical protein